MNQLEMFTYNGNVIRTEVDANGVLWYCAQDICVNLELKDISKATKDLDEKNLIRIMIVSGGQNRNLLFVNKKGVIQLLMKSRKPSVKPFIDWCYDVIVQVMETGSYAIQPKVYSAIELMEMSLAHMKEIESLKVKNQALEMTNTIVEEKLIKTERLAGLWDNLFMSSNDISCSDFHKNVDWVNTIGRTCTRNQLYEFFRFQGWMHNKCKKELLNETENSGTKATIAGEKLGFSTKKSNIGRNNHEDIIVDRICMTKELVENMLEGSDFGSDFRTSLVEFLEYKDADKKKIKTLKKIKI
jgi:prophage antirepressor-like protein